MMIEQIGGSSRPPSNPIGSLFQTPALLRIGAGVVLMSRHAWDAVFKAYHFIWHEAAWDWKLAFESAGVPYPHLAAPTVAVLLAVIAASWILGFLTRLFSLLFIPIGLLGLMFAKASFPALSELCLLYLLISSTLMLYGSGAISIDQLFNLGSRRKSSRPRY